MPGPYAPKIRAKSEWDGDCLIYGGATDGHGYGVVYTERGMSKRAHRVLYAEEVGDPGDLFVCHSCDRPACVNPAHLWLGTAGDNARDRELKNRGHHDVVMDGSGGVLMPRREMDAKYGDPAEPHKYLVRFEPTLWLLIVRRALRKRWSINRTINEGMKDVTDE